MTIVWRPRGDLGRAPAPRTDADAALYERLAERLSIDIKPEPSGAIDYEDWIEPATLLDAALAEGYAVDVYSDRPLSDLTEADRIAHVPGQPTPAILLSPLRRTDFSSIKAWGLRWPELGKVSPNRYAELATFHRHAGRRLRLADMPGEIDTTRPRRSLLGEVDPGCDLGQACLAFAGGSVLVKQVVPAKAHPLVEIELPQGCSAETAASLFKDQVGFHLCRFEGEPNALLVQDRVVMECETRFFVIGHTVVTGAACIESDTPMQRPPGAGILPARFERSRNNGDVFLDTGIRDVLIDKARQIATEIAEECPGIGAYTLDLAIDDSGNALVIEMNDAPNSGLYANDAQALVNAIVQATHQ